MRSLDTAAGLTGDVLDLLMKAGRALAASESVPDSLAAVAEICASDFAEYCGINVVIDGLEREEFDVSAGIHPGQPAVEAGRIVQPLLARRTRLGAVTCLTSAPLGFDEPVRRAIELIAMQLAVVLTAHVAALREHQVADRFQRALLPPSFPKAEGTEFHAVYEPASDEADVGGDWYDVFTLQDGRVAISVGDVAGHGLDAAVIMGEVRQALRTAAVREGVLPSEVLEYVNGVLRLRDSIGMVTAIFGTYDPHTSLLQYAAAGHPPPILALASGFTRQLPSGGLPLGCSDRVDSEDWTFTIPQEARAIFYTDGLIENERDLIAGEEGLLAAINSLDWDRGNDPADAIARRVFAGNANRDDAAVLVLTRRAPVASYTFSAVTVVSPLARAIVDRELRRLDLNEDKKFGVLVAVGEAIANAVEHAYRGADPGLIRLLVERNARQLAVTVEDFGRWRPFVRREERGRGIELMHAFMDGVQIRSTRESTAIVLRMQLAG